MTETDIKCGHTKTTLHASGVNRSRKIITFSHLNYSFRHLCFSSSLRLGALPSCFLMTSFTSVSIAPLVCSTASKLNLTVHKNSTCYHITTETVNCKIVNRTLQWFQNKRSSHWRCSIKEGVLKRFAIFPGKHLFQSLLLIKLQATPFQQNSSRWLLLESMYLRKYEIKIVQFEDNIFSVQF